LAALLVFVLAFGVAYGVVAAVVLLVVLLPVVAVVLAVDRYRLNRRLGNGEVARAYARMAGPQGSRDRFTGVLTVTSDGIRWIPLQRFRRRGAVDVFLPWNDVRSVTTARVSPAWLSWAVRNDVLAIEWLGGSVAFSVTSPQVIYPELRDRGYPISA
jgi:hypothetical protein